MVFSLTLYMCLYIRSLPFRHGNIKLTILPTPESSLLPTPTPATGLYVHVTHGAIQDARSQLTWSACLSATPWSTLSDVNPLSSGVMVVSYIQPFRVLQQWQWALFYYVYFDYLILIWQLFLIFKLDWAHHLQKLFLYSSHWALQTL